MSMGTVFVLYLERVNIVPLQPLMQLEIFWETPRTQLGALLLDLFSSYIAFFLQYTFFSLSQTLRIVTFMLRESTTGYSKITRESITEPELDSSSMSYDTDDN